MADFSHYDLIGVPVVVFTPDAAGMPVCAWMNGCALEFLGTSSDPIMGEVPGHVFGGADDAHPSARFAALMTGQKQTFTVQVEHEAGVRHGRCTLLPVTSESGHVSHVVGTVQDVTVEANAIADLEKERATAMQIAAFLGRAAHDLRGQLGNVRLLADNLRRRTVDTGDDEIQKMDMLQTVSNNAIGLVSDMTDFASAVQACPDRRVFALGTVCAEIMRFLDPIGTHDLVCPDLELDTDHVALGILLRVLVSDAIAEVGRVPVALDLRVGAQSPNRLKFTITSDGKGFRNAETHLARTKSPEGKSGYGREGLRYLLETCDGTIHFRDKTEVSVTLPGTLACRSASRPGSVHARVQDVGQAARPV